MGKSGNETIRQRAKRDATLAMADEFAALAQSLRDAGRTAKSDRAGISRWAEDSVDQLYAGYGRNINAMNAQVAASNMGTSGMRFQGLGDLATAKMMGENAIQEQAGNRFKETVDRLAQTISDVRTAKLGASRKKGMLIGQLIDKYSQEERAMAQQDEANRISWYNAKTSRMSADPGGDGKAGTTVDWDRIEEWVDKGRTASRSGGPLFYPHEGWDMFAGRMQSEADRKRLWTMLYPNTPYKPGGPTGAPGAKSVTPTVTPTSFLQEPNYAKIFDPSGAVVTGLTSKPFTAIPNAQANALAQQGPPSWMYGNTLLGGSQAQINQAPAPSFMDPFRDLFFQSSIFGR